VRFILSIPTAGVALIAFAYAPATCCDASGIT